MKSALIGSTGFVGSNLSSQFSFSDHYNSQNISDIKGKSYDLIVSAGTKAERWKANLDPESDWLGIKMLLENLEQASAKHFILISTVDVYPNPVGVDEDEIINSSLFTGAYGKNRYEMELFIKDHFSNLTIVRCPQLYGDGLKKNFVYDLIYDNALDFTHKDTTMQFYNLNNMWSDIQTAVNNNLPIVNLAVEPTTAHEIAKYTINFDFQNITEKPPLKYDLQTKYAHLYGSKGRYIYNKKKTLEDLKNFIQIERKKISK